MSAIVRTGKTIQLTDGQVQIKPETTKDKRDHGRSENLAQGMTKIWLKRLKETCAFAGKKMGEVANCALYYHF